VRFIIAKPDDILYQRIAVLGSGSFDLDFENDLAAFENQIIPCLPTEGKLTAQPASIALCATGNSSGNPVIWSGFVSITEPVYPPLNKHSPYLIQARALLGKQPSPFTFTVIGRLLQVRNRSVQMDLQSRNSTG
jgi:hypothetical protein